jgi:Lsr2
MCKLLQHVMLLKRYIPTEKGTAVASKVIIEVTDDLDGSKAEETVRFAIDGAQFEIDLSKAHAEELRVVLEPYMKAGRRTGGRRDGRRRSSAAGVDKDQIKAMRGWAKGKGLKVSERGRISAEVQEAYNKAH